MSTIQVPKRWDYVKLSESINDIIGGDWGESDNENIPKDFVRVKALRGIDISNWGVDKGKNASYRIIKKTSLKKRNLDEGDIIIEVSGGSTKFNVGRTILIDNEVLENCDVPIICANFFRKMRFKLEFNPKFVKYFLDYNYQNSHKMKKFIKQTTNLQNFNVTKFLDEVNIPKIDPKIQQKIVKKLDNILEKLEDKKKEILEIDQRNIDKIKKLIVNANGFLFQSLLKNTKTTTVQLESLLDGIKLGSNEKSIKDIEGIPVLRMPNIQNGKIDYSDLKFTKFSKKDEEKYLLRIGDVLVNRTNSAELVGKTAVFERDEKYAFASYIIRLRLKDNTIPQFISNYINSSIGRKYIESVYVKTSGQANINSEHLKSMLIQLPNISDQKKILKKLKNLNSGISNLQTKLSTLIKSQKMTKNYLGSLNSSILHEAFLGNLVN